MTTQEEVYRQFEEFDFDTEDFKNGLENVFESYLDQVNQYNDGQINQRISEIKPEEKKRLESQAKTFYFCKETGNIMNIEDYEEWRATATTDEPEYSSNYQEIVEIILSGKEVPGIKQIPDTVLEGASSTPQVNQRKKPWEVKQEVSETPEDEQDKDIEQTVDNYIEDTKG